MERLKTTEAENLDKESIEKKFAEFRAKINEIVDYINGKELEGACVKAIEELPNETKLSALGYVEESDDDDDVCLEKEPPFTIIVNDRFCSYEYPLNISKKYSINKIVEKIYGAFSVEEDIKPIRKVDLKCLLSKIIR